MLPSSFFAINSERGEVVGPAKFTLRLQAAASRRSPPDTLNPPFPPAPNTMHAFVHHGSMGGSCLSQPPSHRKNTVEIVPDRTVVPVVTGDRPGAMDYWNPGTNGNPPHRDVCAAAHARQHQGPNAGHHPTGNFTSVKVQPVNWLRFTSPRWLP